MAGKPPECTYEPITGIDSSTQGDARDGSAGIDRSINERIMGFWKDNCKTLTECVDKLDKLTPKYNGYVNYLMTLGKDVGFSGGTATRVPDTSGTGYEISNSPMMTQKAYDAIIENANEWSKEEYSWYKINWSLISFKPIAYKSDGFDFKKEIAQAQNIWKAAGASVGTTSVVTEGERSQGYTGYNEGTADIKQDLKLYLWLEPYLWSKSKYPPAAAGSDEAQIQASGLRKPFLGLEGADLNAAKHWVKYSDLAATTMQEMKECAHKIAQLEMKWNKMMNQIQGQIVIGRANPWWTKAGIDEWLNRDARDRVKDFELLEQRKGAGVGAHVYRGDFDQLLYKEQCYLLARVFELSQYKRDFLEGDRIRLAEGKHKENPDASKIVKAMAKGVPYSNMPTNSTILAHGDPSTFINKLTQHPSKDVFFDAGEEIISALVPQIRLFKIITDADTGDESQKEYIFDTHTTAKDLERLMQNKNKRGFGVGIKNLNITYAGTNFFSAQKDIKGSLTIYANSFDELMIDRGGYRYIDLALKTGKPFDLSKLTANNRKSVQKTLDKTHTEILQENNDLNFRLKALIGWAQPKGALPMSTTKRNELLGALNNSYVTINLTPTIHTFNIDDSGKVEFKVEFWAYVDHFFDSPQFNIFTSPSNLKNLLTRNLMYDHMKKQCKKKDENQQKKIADQVRRDKIVGMQTLMCKLRNWQRIYYIDIGREQLKSFISEGPYAKYPKQLDITNTGDVKALERDLAKLYGSHGTDDELTRNALFAAAVVHPENENLAFFYASDLVDGIMHLIETTFQTADTTIDGVTTLSKMNVEKKQLKQRYRGFLQKYRRFRCLLGPVEIVNPKSGVDSEFVNLGDLPVSVKYFNEWLSKKVLAKGEVEYNLSKFLSDFFNDLISTFMNDDSCFKTNGKQKVLLNQTVITSYADKPDSNKRKWMSAAKGNNLGVIPDEVTSVVLEQYASLKSIGAYPSPRLYLTDPSLRRPLLNISGPTGPIVDAGVGLETNFLVFFAARTMPTEYMNGNRSEDHSRGIFHYVAGRRSGLVKTIKLQRTNVKSGYKEARFEQNGYDGLQQLREVYDVFIECYADVQVFPGTYIFVDPKGWAPNMSFNLRAEGFDLDDLTDYGLGGYYMVTKAEHDFGPGKAHTKITAKWVASIEKGFLPGSTSAATHASKRAPTERDRCGADAKERRQGKVHNILGADEFKLIMHTQKTKKDSVGGGQ